MRDTERQTDTERNRDRDRDRDRQRDRQRQGEGERRREVEQYKIVKALVNTIEFPNNFGCVCLQGICCLYDSKSS